MLLAFLRKTALAFGIKQLDDKLQHGKQKSLDHTKRSLRQPAGLTPFAYGSLSA